MAHECIDCGCECYCHRDIYDCVVSLTPSNCEGCGCEDYEDDEFDDDDEFDEVYDDISEII